ncbi:hypothetical protein ACQ4PT_013114 [Festuca glaucescens]
MAASTIRVEAFEAMRLYRTGEHTAALARAKELARANPDSALVLNVLGTLHVHASSAAWNGRALGDEEAASEVDSSHRRDAVDAFSAAARIAPNCVMTAVLHAQALAAEQRFAEAIPEVARIVGKPVDQVDDPKLHNVMYDMESISDCSDRKIHAILKGDDFVKNIAAKINNEIVPMEAAQLLGGDTAADQVRGRAELMSQVYPYSARAQLLLVYVELEHVRALDLAADKEPQLRRILALISSAADAFDESERECHRALRIEDPTDPNLEDIPPAVSVPGADCESRVASVKRQLRALLKRIVVMAAACWSSVRYTDHRTMVTSLRVKMMQAHYDGIDQPAAAKSISDALRFLKNQRSWSFLVCPNSSCRGKKFLNTESLWVHMCSKHPDELWDKLQSVLGSALHQNTSKDDHSFDEITLIQDSEMHDIFKLPDVQPMFESLLVSPSIGIQAEPLAEMRQRKYREGAEIIADIKKKLRMLPRDELNTEHEELCFAIKDLWLKFLKTSALDHREVILPLARSFQWIQMKNSIALSAKDLGGLIGGANIDIMFSKVPAAPDRDVSVAHGSKPSHASNIDNRSGENLQTENLQPLCSDETLKDGEKCEESLVHNIGTSGQYVKEMASTSSCQQTLNVFKKNYADKDMSILSLVIRSLCNLRHFREKVLTEPLVWIPYLEKNIIAHKFYEVFSSWDKNDHALTDDVLTCLKSFLCAYTTDEKIKSFAELRVPLDDQFYMGNCKGCRSPLNTDLLLLNTPYFLTIVLNWLSGSESQDKLSEVLAGITSPVDIGFFCRSADSSTMYTVTSMICCADESYVCFARDDEDRWLIYDFYTVEREDTWEHLLERFKDCKLQPQVLFFEVIK